MNAKAQALAPAVELARANPVRMPNENAEYRAARTALLAEEIELRRRIERVAAQRRALPPGGRVAGDYRFQGEDGPTDFAGLFDGKQTAMTAEMKLESGDTFALSGEKYGEGTLLIRISPTTASNDAPRTQQAS